MLFFITLKSASKLCFKRGSERANGQRVRELMSREWESGEWSVESGCFGVAVKIVKKKVDTLTPPAIPL